MPTRVQCVMLVGAAVVLRAAMFSLPHSGMGHPPIRGDYEAQRHWMEVTVNLPIFDWYRNTKDNDLLYWGLDYPPLTAYVSWAFGRIARAALPSLVAMRESRMDESPAGKLFMRSSVLATDLLIYIPACIALMYVLHSLRTSAAKGIATSSPIVSGLALMLLHPGLLIIDHGHFQYNSFSLGLALAAVAAAGFKQYLICASLFSLALNFKQMCLYYAPAFFVFLLFAAWTDAPSVITIRIRKWQWNPSNALHCVIALAAIGFVVIRTFAVLWAPFCVYTPESEGGCGAGLHSVLRRLFPFDRNLFEDKVGNIWCALEPVLKWRQKLMGRQPGPGSGHATIAVICAASTLVLMLPSLVLLCLAVLDKLRPSAKTNGGTSGSGSLVEPAEGKPNGSSVASKAAETPSTSNIRVRRRSIGGIKRQESALPAAGWGEWTGPTAAAAEAGSATTAPTVTATGSAIGERSAPSAIEHLLLCMFCVSMAFFLASYQVHEKSILLPALPIAALAHRLPLLSTWFAIVSTWSMWPLLFKDGLLVQAAALTMMYAMVAWKSRNAGGITSTSEVQALQKALIALRRPSLASRARIGFMSALASLLLAAVLASLAAILIPAPARLRDLHQYLSACVSAASFIVALFFGTAIQAGWLLS